MKALGDDSDNEDTATVSVFNAAGILAKPFVTGSAAAPSASELFHQLLHFCLRNKQSHLEHLLADIIVAAETAAPEVGVGMLAAVADKLLQAAESAIEGTADRKVVRQHQQGRGASSGKDSAADLLHQQESALLVLVLFARKGLPQSQTVLGLFLCQVPLWCTT